MEQSNSTTPKLALFIEELAARLTETRNLQDMIQRDLSKLFPATPVGEVCDEKQLEPDGYLEKMQHLLNKAGEITQKQTAIAKTLQELL